MASKTVRSGLIKRIHVNGALLRQAQRSGRKAKKPISIQNSQGLKTTNTAELWHDGKKVAELVYAPERQLSSGAVLWLETNESRGKVQVSARAI